MDLLVAFGGDPAGSNMARSLAGGMEEAAPGEAAPGEAAPGGGAAGEGTAGGGAPGSLFHGRHFDLLVIRTPAVSADWLEERYAGYDSFVFLSKHAAASGVLALTCHSTGNFSRAEAGGNDRQVAVPYPSLQKRYLQNLSENRGRFPGFDITIEATHHGPSALSRPCLFVEIGTGPEQWNDTDLCGAVAGIVLETMREPVPQVPFAVCFGGTHYSEKFTGELLSGGLGLGTVVPKHALGFLDQGLFDHIIQRNTGAAAVLLDWTGLGSHKQRVLEMADRTGLEIIRL